MMEPSDRLWVELIFPWCGPQALLPLRSVCRGFRDRLGEAPPRLWQPLTMELSSMRYDERLAGWPGVLKAAAREEKTRANCDAGMYVRVPLPTDVKHALYVNGRIVAWTSNEGRHTIDLFDSSTGALLVTMDNSCGFRRGHDEAILDRWVVGWCKDKESVFLLDCAAARMVELAPLLVTFFQTLTVCGAFMAHSSTYGSEITVLRIAGGPDNTTIVHEVARLCRLHKSDDFALCERGHSYMLFGENIGTLQLFDVATQMLKRAFTMRACPARSALLVLLTYLLRSCNKRTGARFWMHILS